MICSTCKVEREPSEFYVRRSRPKGRDSQCKTCRAAYFRQWKIDKPDKFRAKDVRRRELHPDRETKRWRAKRLISVDRNKAQDALKNAVAAGRIVRPSACSTCGAAGRIVGHHPDYLKPLDVEWLCTRCHSTRPHVIPRAAV